MYDTNSFYKCYSSTFFPRVENFNELWNFLDFSKAYITLTRENLEENPCKSSMWWSAEEAHPFDRIFYLIMEDI